MPERPDDPVTAALRPLLDTPSATPRPVAEIANAARHRRLRRRTMAVAAVTVVVLGVAALVTTLDDPQAVTTVNQPNPSDPPVSDRSTSSRDDREPTMSADTGPSSSTTAPATTADTEPPDGDASPEPQSPPPPPGGPYDPFAGLEAEAAAPAGRASPNGDTTTNAVRLGEGDQLLFTDVDFGTRLATRVEVVASSGAPSGRTTTVAIRLDHPEAPPIATIQVPGTGDWQRFNPIAVPTAAAIGGRHHIYVTVHTDAPGDSVAVDRIRFTL